MNSKIYHYTTILIIFIIPLLLGINTYNIYTNFSHKKKKTSFEPGQAYRDIANNLQKIHIVGFHTDSNMSSENNDAEFLMAQYMMAPIVLDYNNTTHPIHLLSYQDEKKALAKVKELGGQLVYHNSFGKAIIVKTNILNQ